MSPLIRIAWWDISNNIYNKMPWFPQVEPALTQIEKWKNKYEILYPHRIFWFEEKRPNDVSNIKIPLEINNITTNLFFTDFYQNKDEREKFSLIKFVIRNKNNIHVNWEDIIDGNPAPLIDISVNQPTIISPLFNFSRYYTDKNNLPMPTISDVPFWGKIVSWNIQGWWGDGTSSSRKIYCLRRNFDSAALANKFVTDDNGDYNNPVENFGGGDLSEVIYDSSQNGQNFSPATTNHINVPPASNVKDIWSVWMIWAETSGGKSPYILHYEPNYWKLGPSELRDIRVEEDIPGLGESGHMPTWTFDISSTAIESAQFRPVYQTRVVNEVSTDVSGILLAEVSGNVTKLSIQPNGISNNYQIFDSSHNLNINNVWDISASNLISATFNNFAPNIYPSPLNAPSKRISWIPPQDWGTEPPGYWDNGIKSKRFVYCWQKDFSGPNHAAAASQFIADDSGNYIDTTCSTLWGYSVDNDDLKDFQYHGLKTPTHLVGPTAGYGGIYDLSPSRGIAIEPEFAPQAGIFPSTNESWNGTEWVQSSTDGRRRHLTFTMREADGCSTIWAIWAATRYGATDYKLVGEEFFNNN